MKTMFSKICSLASLLLALTLTFSCSNDDGDGSGNGGGGGNNGSLESNPEYQEYKEYLKYYDPENPEQRCQSGVTEFKCGDKGWYNPLNYDCTYSCGDGEGCYNYELRKLEICGNEIYVSKPTRRCQDGVLQRKCGDVWYNGETHYCDDGLKAKERCGSKYYIPEEGYTRCQNGVIQERCGGWNQDEEPIWYNSETHYCTNFGIVKAKERCGNSYVSDEYERCNNGVFEEICIGMPNDANAIWYNDMTQSCDWNTGVVRNKLVGLNLEKIF